MSEILHYGIKRRSGRYPYGSGSRPFQDRIKAVKAGRKATSYKTKQSIRNKALPRLDKRLEEMKKEYGVSYNRQTGEFEGVDKNLKEFEKQFGKEVCRIFIEEGREYFEEEEKYFGKKWVDNLLSTTVVPTKYR